jgi:hypothetical protein
MINGAAGNLMQGAQTLGTGVATVMGRSAALASGGMGAAGLLTQDAANIMGQAQSQGRMATPGDLSNPLTGVGGLLGPSSTATMFGGGQPSSPIGGGGIGGLAGGLAGGLGGGLFDMGQAAKGVAGGVAKGVGSAVGGLAGAAGSIFGGAGGMLGGIAGMFGGIGDMLGGPQAAPDQQVKNPRVSMMWYGSAIGPVQVALDSIKQSPPDPRNAVHNLFLARDAMEVVQSATQRPDISAQILALMNQVESSITQIQPHAGVRAGMEGTKKMVSDLIPLIEGAHGHLIEHGMDDDSERVMMAMWQKSAVHPAKEALEEMSKDNADPAVAHSLLKRSASGIGMAMLGMPKNRHQDMYAISTRLDLAMNRLEVQMGTVHPLPTQEPALASIIYFGERIGNEL